MDDLTQLRPSGIFLRSEALDHGYDDDDLRGARLDGAITRVRHGAYVASPTWAVADDPQRHLLKARAVLLTHPDRVALTHTTAAVAHGVSLWEPDLDRVHVVRLDRGTSRRASDVVHHRSDWVTGEHISEVDGLPVVVPHVAALQAASFVDVEHGLVALDSLLALDPDHLDAMWRAFTTHLRGTPFCRKLQVTLRLARVGAQSPGESRTRYLCWSQHLPEPILQFPVHGPDGELIGTTDFAWPDHRLLGEFDGRVKYGRLLRPGQTASDVVFAEKIREDRIREATCWALIRLIWGDLATPYDTAQRIRRLMRLGAA